MVQSLSLGYRKDQRIIKHVKANVKKRTPEIFAIRKLPDTIIPSDFYPSAAKLQQQKKIGRNNSLKSYCVVSNLSQIAVILWKNETCNATDTTSLAKALPYREKTLLKLQEYRQIGFTALQLLPVDYDTATSDSEEKAIVRNKKKSFVTPASYTTTWI